jgi:hypothetical protein
LKEQNLVRTIWIPGDTNSTDMYTKNLAGPLFEKHARTYVGNDEYMRSQGESVGG